MFLKLTRGIGKRAGHKRWVNFDHVTDFCEDPRHTGLTAIYMPAASAGESEDSQPFVILVRESPEEIAAALTAGPRGDAWMAWKASAKAAKAQREGVEGGER